MTETPIPASRSQMAAGDALRTFLGRPDSDEALRATRVDWASHAIVSAPPVVQELLVKSGGVAENRRSLTPIGLRLLGRLQLDLTDALRNSAVASRYEILGELAHGRHSIAYRAMNPRIGRRFVIKVLRPGTSSSTRDNLLRLGNLPESPHLVKPVDFDTFDSTTSSGDPISLEYLLYPMVSGTTLDDYLRRHPPLVPAFFDTFISQVARVLASLETLGLAHGDLHGANIIVTEAPSEPLTFTLIDPSPGLDGPTSPGRPRTDLQWFQAHLAQALTELRALLPTVSVPKYLGPRLYSLIEHILTQEALRFEEILRLQASDARFVKWTAARADFLSRKFTEPQPLGLLRWEEIANPALALALFEPQPDLFRRLRRFGPAKLVGARGSGKSTYLAALAYFPDTQDRAVSPGDVFGVLFSCRQGEFRQFSEDLLPLSSRGKLALKHILVIKTIRRILGAIATGCDREELQVSGSLDELYRFVQVKMDGLGRVPRLTADGRTAIHNLFVGVQRWEDLEIARLFDGAEPTPQRVAQFHDETSLAYFCGLVRAALPALAATQFYLLFDDAGSPNLPTQLQEALNDLVISTNPLYCIKISSERYSYSHEALSGRKLEESHDFTTLDIATAYSLKGGATDARKELREHSARILSRRLRYWQFKHVDIHTYLGKAPLSMKELVSRLALNRRNAYYSGWEVLWQIADRSPRSLIEMVSEVFAAAGIAPTNETDASLPVPPQVQDKAIRRVSERRLRSLELVPGTVQVRGKTTPLGRHLFGCTVAFGAVSKRYLSASALGASGGRRLDERLAIERNDNQILPNEAALVLEQLVKYGIFDDSTLGVAFDDAQKKPLYVFNRLFAPAFGISPRRDAHLRLSVEKLALFLMRPARFVTHGTELLQQRGGLPLQYEIMDDSDD